MQERTVTNKRENRNAFVHLPPLVRLEGICKSFGRVRANHDISLDIRPGMIKALLGENGAGKSTLMSILSGRFAQTSGTIYVDEKPVRFGSPRDAIHAGIGMVYQHFMLVESMTVAQNVLLGQENSWRISPRAMEAEVAALSGRYGLPIDPAARVCDLSMGEKQRVEILKLLYRDSRILILDEPTAVLTPAETDQLFEAMWRMADQGKSIVFISHKLTEVLTVADEIAILRRGEIVDEFHESDVPNETVLANRMVGRDVVLAVEAEPVTPGNVVLDIVNLSGDGLESLSLTVRKGEVLAIAGVAGNGQKELVEVVCGLRKPVSGRVEILGLEWHRFYPRPPRKGKSLAYIPEDRQGLATCKYLNLVDNFLLTTRHAFTNGPFLNRKAAAETTVRIIDEYNVQPGHIDGTARSLSGGNLQKLVIGREFFREPDIIVAENPTQGLDIAATEEVWQRLLEARKRAGILLITSELNEALQLADYIAVMYRGRFMGLFHKSDTAKVEAIGLMMAGVASPAA
ncbi:ABC transporter ATP-binding protein [Desulfovibrio psychrotolerans]|uniref:Branched chain amino acid ABC transporter ATP-binding protein n=1 Tax=Desulfovibrio psychrotolerans TaxID=415242 RepID=A0A7J0BQ19_9BACT|nr:ABC transporter ATP-binding protein [Desulfovibrio psychrotolerans]GFM35759.1 branched chain amino acid ABC transporter ATP-binding protein [Desulfovibrio psychrotolerans]